MKDFYKNVINDVKTNLMDEFDRNFERKAFFDNAWPTTKWNNSKGSLMMRSGKLRNSLKGTVQAEGISFTSNMPYASIHNEGGEITVTDKMKRFAWAMYYKTSGAISGKGGGQRNIRLSQEAAQWKALALIKVGTKIKIDKRQFIGDHPKVGDAIKEAIDINLKELNEYMINQLKQK